MSEPCNALVLAAKVRELAAQARLVASFLEFRDRIHLLGCAEGLDQEALRLESQGIAPILSAEPREGAGFREPLP